MFVHDSCMLQTPDNAPSGPTKRRAAPVAAVVLTAVCLVGLAGWLTVSETPAAQRNVETVKPYDPLP